MCEYKVNITLFSIMRSQHNKTCNNSFMDERHEYKYIFVLYSCLQQANLKLSSIGSYHINKLICSM